MDAAFLQDSLLRIPTWRADSVLHLVQHRPHALALRGFDDQYVQTYYSFLLEYSSAGDRDESRQQVLLAYPDLYRAHELQHSPDSQSRTTLEAWLLTTEPYAEIARRLSISELTIDYFEKLFLIFVIACRTPIGLSK